MAKYEYVSLIIIEINKTESFLYLVIHGGGSWNRCVRMFE